MIVILLSTKIFFLYSLVDVYKFMIKLDTKDWDHKVFFPQEIVKPEDILLIDFAYR